MSTKNFKKSTLSGFLNYDFSNYKIFHLFPIFLNKYNLKEDQLKECPICLSYPDFPCKTNQCLHVYCFRCLYIWKKKNNFCPYCRKKFINIIII